MKRLVSSLLAVGAITTLVTSSVPASAATAFQIREVQSDLIYCGFLPPGSATGIMTPQTSTAIINFKGVIRTAQNKVLYQQGMATRTHDFTDTITTEFYTEVNSICTGWAYTPRPRTAPR